MAFEPNWKPPSNMPILDICAAVQREAINIVETYTPDLIDLFPFRRQLRARISLMSGWLGFVMDFKGGSGILQLDQLNTQEREDLSKAAEAKITGTHQDLIETIGSSYFGFERFTYLGPWDGQKLSWPHVGRHLADWMNSYLLPEVLRRNTSRVLRAVPLPPIYNFNDVSKALWILECEESSQQGTAFYLEGIGLVTCEHVLGSNTMAFQVDSIHHRRPVKIIAKNKDLDLAILQVDGSINGELRKGTADKLSQMDHIAIFGYPNYRLGDTGVVVPGLVVGFRPVTGIQRILTNAPIVAGASGAPALDATGCVIGVAATGKDRMEDVQDTEHHSVIPIDALKFLAG